MSGEVDAHSRCPHIVGHPDSTQHCALNGPDLSDLRAAWETTQGTGRSVRILDAVDRLLATEGGE